MNSLAAARSHVAALAVGVRCDDDRLYVDLSDGRGLSVPLAWFPRLLDASPRDRSDWRLIGGGEGIHWENIDEDISTQGLLNGECLTRFPHA